MTKPQGHAIRTASDLKRAILAHGKAPHYFDRGTMRAFGDTMRNYGVRVVPEHNAFELYRRRPNRKGETASIYWCATEFRLRHDLNRSLNGRDPQ